MHRVLPFSLLLTLPFSGYAQLHPKTRFAITSEQVTAQLNSIFAKKGVALLPSQVSLPATVTATQSSPALTVQSVESLGDLHVVGAQTSAVKLRCNAPGTCLPFYALIAWPDAHDGKAATTRDLSLRKGQMAEAIVIQPGAPLLLLLTSGSTQIQMSVISTERGAIGSRIHVRSSDHKQMYSAEVVSANLVKGTF